jgi:hypothetical protein
MSRYGTHKLAAADTSRAAPMVRRRSLIQLGNNAQGAEVIDELFVSALCVATITSLFRCFATGRSVRMATDASSYLPWLPVLFVTADRARIADAMGSHVVTHVEGIYARLAELLSTLPEGQDWLAPSQATREEWRKRADVWAMLSGEFRVVLMALCNGPNVRAFRKWARGLEIENLLKLARSGLTPCVRSDGVIITPIWFDARREPRVPLSVACSIETGGLSTRVMLRDVSLSGYCVGSAPSLARGTGVILNLPTNHTIPGMVMWSCGGVLGIRCSTALDEGDDVVVAIRRLRSP